jgi:transposase-like protein
MARKQPKPVHQLTAAEFERMFPDEDACRAYLVARRWGDVVRCPRCGAEARPVSTMAWHWQCKGCAPDTTYRFSHLTGTIFENTNKPLRDWYRVIHLMLTSKKGMSALQIHRFLGFGSYKTAWLMCHKVRTALVEDIDQLAGIVEVPKPSSAARQRTGISTSAAAPAVAALGPARYPLPALSAARATWWPA